MFVVLSIKFKKMSASTIEIPNKRVISLVHLMRQELFSAYTITEIESLIHYCFREICGFNRMDVMMRSEEELDEKSMNRFVDVIERLKKNEPIQYIFGQTEFYNLDIRVNKDVLIPRPETEELVHWVIREQQLRQVKDILDIGTGSGCMALALKDNLPETTVTGIDVSAEAIQVARENAELNDLEVEFLQANILNDLPNFGEFDVIVSNPPYVTRSQMNAMHPNVVVHEPHVALFIEDDDPLKFYKAIAHFCRKHLRPDGVLYLEVNEDLAGDTAMLLESFNFTRTNIKKDLNGKFRMVKARW